MKMFAVAFIITCCIGLGAYSSSVAGEAEAMRIKEEVERAIAKDNEYAEVIVTMPSVLQMMDQPVLVEHQYSTVPRRVAVKVRDRHNIEHVIKAKFDEAIRIPAPRSLIAKGSVIVEDDLVTMKFPKNRDPHSIVVSSQELIGNTARRNLQPRKFISKYDIVKGGVVQKGQPIRMLYSKGALSIEARGVAQENGAVGDYIGVRNNDSNKVVSGKVLSADAVLVEAR